MVSLQDGTQVFVRDCINFEYPLLGVVTSGIVIKFAMEASVMLKVILMVDVIGP